MAVKAIIIAINSNFANSVENDCDALHGHLHGHLHVHLHVHHDDLLVDCYDDDLLFQSCACHRRAIDFDSDGNCYSCDATSYFLPMDYLDLPCPYCCVHGDVGASVSRDDCDGLHAHLDGYYDLLLLAASLIILLRFYIVSNN